MSAEFVLTVWDFNKQYGTEPEDFERFSSWYEAIDKAKKLFTHLDQKQKDAIINADQTPIEKAVGIDHNNERPYIGIIITKVRGATNMSRWLVRANSKASKPFTFSGIILGTELINFDDDEDNSFRPDNYADEMFPESSANFHDGSRIFIYSDKKADKPNQFRSGSADSNSAIMQVLPFYYICRLRDTVFMAQMHGM